MYHCTINRRTGRTTRLLKHAIDLAREGRKVYVVAANEEHRQLLQQCLDFMTPRDHGISIENGNRFPELDWNTMTMPRAHPNCTVLVDHYTIEQRIRAAIEMMTRFDI